MFYMVAGDTHGDSEHCKYLIEQAEKNNIDVIVQLGDFGYWEHSKDGQLFLKYLNEALKRAGINLFWLDGNHENHTKLREDYGVDIENPEPVGIRSNIVYLPRATTWEWQGIRHMAVGGAWSIDYKFRTPGRSWWPEEMISTEEEKLAISRGPVDILLTHDVPDGVDINTHFAIQGRDFLKADVQSQLNRETVRRIVDGVRPKLLVHGHYHLRYSDKLITNWGEVQIEGYNCDWSHAQSWGILDLEKFKRRYLPSSTGVS